MVGMSSACANFLFHARSATLAGLIHGLWPMNVSRNVKGVRYGRVSAMCVYNAPSSAGWPAWRKIPELGRVGRAERDLPLTAVVGRLARGEHADRRFVEQLAFGGRSTGHERGRRLQRQQRRGQVRLRLRQRDAHAVANGARRVEAGWQVVAVAGLPLRGEPSGA